MSARAWPLGLGPNFVIGEAHDPYLRRWWLIPRNRFCNVYLHQFCRSDDERALHDHPWWNCSMLLTGSYREHQPDGVHVRRRFVPVFRRADHAHRIEVDRPVWTLFLTGPNVRQWGFHCPNGWRHWKDFVSLTPGGNTIGRGCE